MADSKIEWTGRSDWNPVRGCTRASEGCRNCYAETIAGRFSGAGQPFHGFATRTAQGGRWTGKVDLLPNRLTLPMRWRDPALIFANSTSDFFHENLPDEYIDRLFAVMALTPRHTYQVLTKRADRMAAWMTAGGVAARVMHAASRLETNSWGPDWTMNWPLPNVWLGASVEDQEQADKRIPSLLQTPAALRFISAEPLLGPVDLSRWMPRDRYYNALCEKCGHTGSTEFFREARNWDDADVVCPKCDEIILADEIGRIGLVITGGESGRNARPMHPDWARGLRSQCAAAGTSFFFKQWGEWAPHRPAAGGDLGGDVRSGKVRIVHPTAESETEVFRRTGRNTIPGSSYMVRLGKGRTGALLDGREHREMPR